MKLSTLANAQMWVRSSIEFEGWDSVSLFGYCPDDYIKFSTNVKTIFGPR
jgi:hypothetical protein